MFSLGFQMTVLMKLESLIESQHEAAVLMRQIVAHCGKPAAEISDVIPQPCKTLAEMDDLSAHLRTNEAYRKTMVR